jgi:hypothetical protein
MEQALYNLHSKFCLIGICVNGGVQIGCDQHHQKLAGIGIVHIDALLHECHLPLVIILKNPFTVCL